jgi:hypothetical protein
MTKEDVYDLSFNKLDLTKEERSKILLEVGVLFSPFDEGVKDMVMMNPFTFETVNGTKEDGEYIIHHVWTGMIDQKVQFKDGKAIRAWKVNDDNEYEEVFKQDNGYWE